jgi:phosphoribosylformylglycinamidine synthase
MSVEVKERPVATQRLVDEAVALEHKLSLEEYQHILKVMGRVPSLTEIGIFGAMWSEHCSYKSSRIHLSKFPTKAPYVIQGPGENAGVIDIGDGDVAVFKMESHNHPSFIEPYQGAATGVGGILRDVFTMGARPIANLNALRFGDPSHPRTRHLVSGVVSGIGGYGNCMGIPTVGGETNFHKGYNGNILVNAMTVGIAKKDGIFYSAAAGIGNSVVYIGSKTGRDGIHGAVMASDSFEGEMAQHKRPTVQVGDPFVEKLLLEACLELMGMDVIVAIQDMGAAGLTSSSVEMAAKGGVGIEIDLDLVPQREPGMSAYELMLSESQERMLMVLKPGSEAKAEAVLRKWELDFAVIGKITDTGHLVLKRHGKIEADMPVAPLVDDAPKYDRPHVPTPKAKPLDLKKLPDLDYPGQALLTLIGCPDLASRQWIWQQYDSLVRGDTIKGPGAADAAIVRIGEGLEASNKALAITTDCTPRYCLANPYEGGKQAVAEAWRNLVSVGATPLAVTDNLNFGNPTKPHIMGQLVGCIEGLAEACRALDFPVVSGNVSLYNETDGEGIPPTPAIGGVGLIADVRKAVGLAPKAAGETLILIGTAAGHLGQSLYLREVVGLEKGDAPPVDLAIEKQTGMLILSLIDGGHVTACHDISDGGVAVALTEMCLAAKMGATVALENTAGALFGEDQACYIVATTTPDTVLAKAGSIPARVLGATGGKTLTITGVLELPIDKLRTAHESWLPAYMNG